MSPVLENGIREYLLNEPDMRGQKFNHLTVNSKTFRVRNAKGQSQGLCVVAKCDCGRNTVVKIHDLKNGHKKSCGDCSLGNGHPSAVGKRFDQLVVLHEEKYVRYVRIRNGHKVIDYDYHCICRCDCGRVCKRNLMKLELKDRRHCCNHCKKQPKKVPDEEMIGKTFGFATVLSRVGNTGKWNCRCKCGREFVGDGRQLRFGYKTACGKYQYSYRLSNEIVVRDYLKKRKIPFEAQKTYSDLVTKNNRHMFYDFYIVDVTPFLLEMDGLQHFKAIDFFGGKKSFVRAQKRDQFKTEYAKQYHIPLERIDCSRLYCQKNKDKKIVINQLEKLLQKYNH